MKRVLDTNYHSDYQPTSISTGTSSADENPPPSIRTMETRQRDLTVLWNECSCEESMDEEARSEEASQIRPDQEEAHEKAGEPAQSRQASSASLPRYRETVEHIATVSLAPGASGQSSTLETSDVPRVEADPHGAYRLQLDEWVRFAHDMTMECRQELKARIDVYLHSPENAAWTLKFSCLGLKTVPPLPRDHLINLCVNKNQLIALPENLPAGLQKLEVDGNHLSALPERLPAGLQKLYASENQLIALPEHLPACLKELKVHENQLIALPENLPDSLQCLDVSDNQLSALPEHLPAGLQRLYVSDNQLSALPEHLLASLQTLDVRGNQLNALPEHLPVGLKKLFVSGNQLSALPEHLPADLEWLYVGRNQLIALPEHLPAGLKEFDVDGNHLSALSERLPASLKRLNVSKNQLMVLPEHLPAGLQWLYGNDNQLSSLPLCILDIRCTVDLSNNPLPISVLHHLFQITSEPDYSGPYFVFSMAAHEAPLTLESVRPLTDAIQNWLGKESPPWGAFVGEQGATEFSLFLDKLAQSIVGRDPAFRMTFQSWLRDMAVQPSLRAHVFAIAQGATASCQDRVMLTANDMAKARLLFQIERGDYDQKLPELVGIARGMFRLEKLEAIAKKKARSLRLVDEIEVYLAYQVKLREPLRLPLVVGEMAYFKISGVNEQDLLAAEATVKDLENREFKEFLLTWQPWLKVLKGGRGSSEATARARQFALWDREYEQPLASLEEAIETIDRQLKNGSASTTSGTGQTDRLQLERQGLTAQRNALVSSARTLSDDIAHHIANEGNIELPMSASLLDPVWDNDGGYAPASAGAMNAGSHATGT